VCDLETSRIGAPYIHDISSLRVKYEAGWIDKNLMFLLRTEPHFISCPAYTLVTVPTTFSWLVIPVCYGIQHTEYMSEFCVIVKYCVSIVKFKFVLD